MQTTALQGVADTAEYHRGAGFEFQCQQPTGIFVAELLFDLIQRYLQRFIYQVVECRFRHCSYHPVKMCKFNDTGS